MGICSEAEGELSVLSRILNTFIRVNEWSATHPVSKLHTKTVQKNFTYKNDTYKKSGALRISNPCQSIQKLSKFRYRWLGECRCALLLLDVTRLADVSPTKKELMCPSVGEERGTTAVQSAFQSQFDKGPSSRYSIYVGCKTFGHER
jgi:hypothetical protein